MCKSIIHGACRRGSPNLARFLSYMVEHCRCCLLATDSVVRTRVISEGKKRDLAAAARRVLSLSLSLSLSLDICRHAAEQESRTHRRSPMKISPRSRLATHTFCEPNCNLQDALISTVNGWRFHVVCTLRKDESSGRKVGALYVLQWYNGNKSSPVLLRTAPMCIEYIANGPRASAMEFGLF
jgi:hypothetical protein